MSGWSLFFRGRSYPRSNHNPVERRLALITLDEIRIVYGLAARPQEAIPAHLDGQPFRLE